MEKDIFAAMAQYPGQVLYVTPSGIYNQTPISESLLGIITPIQQTPKTEFVTSESPLIQKGWYRYEDRTFSPKPDHSKKITGIVRLIDRTAPLGRQIKSIGLEEKRMQWSSKYYAFGVYDAKDGQKNTDIIVKIAQGQDVQTAAVWCKAQGGYMEAKETLKLMLSGDEEINLPIEKIGATPISQSGYYFTSTEYYNNRYHAWIVRPCGCSSDVGADKASALYVRCTFAD